MIMIHRRDFWARASIGTVAAAMALTASAAGAQLQTWKQAHLSAAHNGAFARRSPDAHRLLNAFDYQQATRYEELWRHPDPAISQLENGGFARLTNIFVNPPRTAIVVRAVAPEFVRLVPEMEVALGWGHMFERQVLDVLAQSPLSEPDRDGRMAELVANYRSRSGVAVSAQPKSMELADGQEHSLGFRQRYPKYNGLMWAARWVRAALRETLASDAPANEIARNQAAVIARFREMTRGAPATTPYLLPLAPAIAPTFARRYPDAAAILDNLYMLEDAIADVLVEREIPQSAKRQEILRVAALFRTDSVASVDVQQWLKNAEEMGLNNMGGAAVGFPAELPTPTVALGASMAAIGRPSMSAMAHDHSAMVRDSMPGMQHAPDKQAQNPTVQALMAIHERMMADPVIRERAASDPVLQRLLKDLPTAAASSMPGMVMPAAPSISMGGSAEERAKAIEFIVRLLADPAVEARIHAYPELHALWSDPEVQKRLAEFRKTNPKPPGGR